MNAGTSSIQLGAIRVDILVEAEDSGGRVTVFECLVPAGAKVPAPHSHDGFEDTVYVLEGTCTWIVDGDVLEAGPGDSVCIRRGQVHGFDNRGIADARFLAIATPGRLRTELLRGAWQSSSAPADPRTSPRSPGACSDTADGRPAARDGALGRAAGLQRGACGLARRAAPPRVDQPRPVVIAYSGERLLGIPEWDVAARRGR
jgi:quercetin dioxygenase-like cupin family protein